MPQAQYASEPPVADRRTEGFRQTDAVSAETLLLLVLGGIAVIVAVRWIADRTGLPAAALLTVAGINAPDHDHPATGGGCTCSSRGDGEIPTSPQYEALRWRDVGRLPDESLRALERELDHEERLLPQRG